MPFQLRPWVKEGLTNIRGNVRTVHASQGLVARKKAALRKVNRMELFSEAARDMTDMQRSSGRGATLVHFSAQLEPFLTQNIP